MAMQPLNRFLQQGMTLERLVRELQDYDAENAAKIKALTDSYAQLLARIEALEKGK